MSKATSRILIFAGAAVVLALLAYPKLKSSAKPGSMGPGVSGAGGAPAPGGAPAAKPGASSQPGGTPGGGAALPVTAKILRAQRLDNSIASTGTVLANEDVEIRSEIQGKIRRIAFKEGAKVNKGDLLVKIDDDELQANLLKDQFHRKLAEDNEYRMRMQLKIEAVSQKDYDQALNEVNLAKAEEQLVRAQLEKTELRAPFSGVVGLKYVSEGAFVSPTTRITTVQEINPLKVDFSVPGKYAGWVKPGQAVRFTVQGSDKAHEGKIYAIDPVIDPQTRTLHIRALCPNLDALVMPGAFAQIDVPLAVVDSALLVPTEALSTDAKGNKVFLFRGGKADPRPVQVGLRTDSAVQVTGGLRSGDTVITSGVIQIRPGAPVSLSLVE